MARAEELIALATGRRNCSSANETPQPSVEVVKNHRGRGAEELATTTISGPDFYDRIKVSGADLLINNCAVELLAGLAEHLDDSKSMWEHTETVRTMQVLAVIRQAYVDSQHSGDAWADLGKRE